MVHIVTGDINSGKTTKLLSLYNASKIGDGFILPKIFIDGKNAGQQIERLSTGESLLFSLKTNYIPAQWNEKYRYEQYSFSYEGFEFAYSIIQEIVIKGIFPAYIDEIGPLELQEKGFYLLLSELIIINYPIYISVRASYLDSVVNKFNIRIYEIINVK